jgi:hypothetical protein
MKGGLIFALTRDVVAKEIGEMLQLKLASVLQVPPNAVSCVVELHVDKVVPHIQVDNDIAEGLSPDQIRKVIQSIWCGVQPVRPGVRDILEERLKGLRSRRVREEAQKEG